MATSRLSFRYKPNQLLRKRIYERDDFTCYICGWRPPSRYIPDGYDGKQTIWYIAGHKLYSLEIDHVKARSKGGSNNIRNLKTICHSCNCSKGARSLKELKNAAH